MRKTLALLWLAVVLATVGQVTWSARNGLPVDSDLMALLPLEERDPVVQEAKDSVAGTLSARVVVMVGHAEREEARTQAARLRTILAEAGVIARAGDIPSPEALLRLGTAFFPHRAGLLSENDRARLEAGDSQALVTRALAQLFGVGGPADSRLLAKDPLMLFPAFLSGLPAPANRLGLDEGMLSVTDGGTTWVMESLVLAGTSTRLDIHKRFAEAYGRFAGTVPQETRLLRLGALFHAEAGARRAMEESRTIGLVSVAGIAVLMLAVFGSARPLLLTLAALGAGMATALFVCLAVWGRVHIAAQLFGAALIGVAVDYALLYFGQAFTPGGTPDQRLSKIQAGMVLGAATTIIGYATLGLSPFPGLRQAALFSAVGLAASLVSVVLWMPLLDNSPSRTLPRATALAATWLWTFWSRPEYSSRRRLALSVLGLLILAGSFCLTTDDDIRHQQTPSARLVAEEAEVRRLTGFGQTGRFFVVQAEDEQQVLEREEALLARLGLGSSALAVSRYIPSARRQAENATLTERGLYAPHLDTYLARSGLGRIAPPALADKPLIPGMIRETGALPMLDALVVRPGLHLVLPGPDATDVLAAAAQGIDGVRFVDPTADLNFLLGAYRLRALVLLAVSALAITPLLLWRYGLRGGLQAMAPATLAVFATPPLLALAGVPFSFFVAMALLPAFAIGSDYALFCAEDGERHPVTLFSVSLALVTTLLSFGLLALSDTAAVRAFGLAMLCAVSLAFLLAPMVRPRGSTQRTAVYHRKF